MEEKLIEYADKLIEALESGISFAGDQAPIFIQELLTYAVYYHVIYMVAFALSFLMCLYMVLGCKYLSDREGFYDFSEWGIGAFISGLMGIVSMFGAIIHLTHLIKVIVAPRVYLIEKISSMF